MSLALSSGFERSLNFDPEVIDICSVGSCAARRLAGRLAPRFLGRFPHLVEASATVLMALYQDKVRSNIDVSSVLESTRADSLRGLGEVLESATKLADKAVPTVLRVVDFLLRYDSR